MDTLTRTLRTGAQIPLIGLGTFGSDRYGPDEVAAAVRGGLEAGYRLVDCASVYGNEPRSVRRSRPAVSPATTSS